MSEAAPDISGDSFKEWIPAGWPARSLAECEAILCAPGAKFEYETIPIRGVPTRVWKNAPENLAALARVGRSHGDATFLIYEDERVSYDAWFRAVAAFGRHLQSLGVTKGDRVALAMRNLPEWPVVFFAAVTIGAICVPLNAWWTGPELAYGLAHSGAKVLVCDGERLDRIAPHRAELADLAQVIVSRRDPVPAGVTALESVIGPSSAWGKLPDQDLPAVAIAPDDDATILYTSGTTGNPKGALGTHRNFVTNILSSAYGAARQVLRRGEPLPDPARKVMLTVIPLFHATACSATMMGAIAAGHTMIFMYKWEPEKAFQIIEREKVNSTGGVPTIAWQLIEHPAREKYDLSSIEAIAYGGAPGAGPGAQDPRSVWRLARQRLGHDRDDRDRYRTFGRRLSQPPDQLRSASCRCQAQGAGRGRPGLATRPDWRTLCFRPDDREGILEQPGSHGCHLHRRLGAHRGPCLARRRRLLLHR